MITLLCPKKLWIISGLIGLIGFGLVMLNANGVSAESCGTGSPKADGLVSAFSIDGNFRSSTCVSGSLSYIPLNQTKIVISNYDSLYNKYYLRNASATKIILDQTIYNSAIANLGANTLLYRNGDLTLQGSALANASGGNVLVFFVNGDLNIQTDITEAQSNLAGGVVFVVKNKVNIDRNVTNINAVIIAGGQICSACDSSGVANNNPTFPFDPPLAVNGSLISLDSQNPIKFARQYNNNLQPAEQINAQAKYLVILQNIFGEKVKIYQEI